MLAKIADELPPRRASCSSPNGTAFARIVFRSGDAAYIQSRDLRPLNRYFPELERRCTSAAQGLRARWRDRGGRRRSGLDFDALQQRLHPAASRVASWPRKRRRRFVAFDLLAAGGKSTDGLPQAERRVRLERLLGSRSRRCT